ncbi:methyltransferase RsmF C-terminal domain-like protein [Flaviaesturariibacter amylovorans]|uniref:rRNA cytosine-C5-methyltransferase n=1 Tax=Flaviaesturariibacter amylovorans TaxID=1084520 RepID=A0ABP8GMS2_9BACT
MPIPEKLLQSLEGVPGYDRAAFTAVHESGAQVTSLRLNPAKPTDGAQLPLAERIPWTRSGYYLTRRPSFTFDPLFHAGTYYVQEASSMFVEQALLQHTDGSTPLTALDLCAAPGGKSTHLQSLLPEGSLLVSNEVIKSRAAILVENLTKWGADNVVVTNNDPQHFARLGGFFEVMVVDAPCSGSGLFRRDPEAINEWSTDNVQLCQGRQQRILADAWPALREDGLLIYSTCSYSPEEDEAILDWLSESFAVESLPVRLQEGWGIVEVRSPGGGAWGYRFYPDKVKGEGFFLAAFRKRESAPAAKGKVQRPELVPAKEAGTLERWVQADGLRFLRHSGRIFALPEPLLSSFTTLQGALYIQNAGLGIGEAIRDKLIPDHALALSPRLHPSVPRTELDAALAVRYLQRADFALDTQKGWQAVTYGGYPLGWINALPNRLNNYYPREWRIRSAGNDATFEK